MFNARATTYLYAGKMMISVKVHQGRKVYLMHMPLENSK